MKKILNYLKIYFLFIFEEYIEDSFWDIRKQYRWMFKPFYYMRFAYMYIFSIVFFPLFVGELIFKMEFDV